MTPYHRIYRIALVLLLAAFAHAITDQDNHVLLADNPVPSIAAKRAKMQTLQVFPSKRAVSVPQFPHFGDMAHPTLS